MKQYFKIGKIVATHGVKGQLILEHSLGKKTSLNGLEWLFIEQNNGDFLPYPITNAKSKNEEETFISIENIDSKEAAQSILKKEVWIDEPDFKKQSAGSAPISLLGYTIFDQGEAIGEIIEVIEQPHQVLCKVMLEDKEALIPVHADSLEKMDTKNRQLHLNIPEGLLDIYRNS